MVLTSVILVCHLRWSARAFALPRNANTGALSSEATVQPLMLLGSENIVPSVLSWGKSPSRAAYTPKESKFTGIPLSIYRHTELFFPLCPQGSWFGTSSWSNSCCTRYHDPLTLGAAIESGLLWKIFFLMVNYLTRSLSFLPTSGLPGGTTQEFIRHVFLYTDSYRLSSRYFWEPSQLCSKQGPRRILGRDLFLKSIYQIVPESLLCLNWETLLFQLTALTRQIAQGQSFPEDQLCWELATKESYSDLSWHHCEAQDHLLYPWA